MNKIWDIGHSNRKEEDFLNLLENHRIERIVDVRRFPTSKKHPHFERAHLVEALRKKGIDYMRLGESLGGFRKGGYEKWMKNESFQAGIAELEEKASQKRTAVMCAENDFRGCHRRFIIAFLEKRGWEFVHISSRLGKEGQTSLFP